MQQGLCPRFINAWAVNACTKFRRRERIAFSNEAIRVQVAAQAMMRLFHGLHRRLPDRPRQWRTLGQVRAHALSAPPMVAAKGHDLGVAGGTPAIAIKRTGFRRRGLRLTTSGRETEMTRPVLGALFIDSEDEKEDDGRE